VVESLYPPQARIQDYVTSAETKELMNRTWQDLELTAKAHTFTGQRPFFLFYA
jgi:hypothetical protein